MITDSSTKQAREERNIETIIDRLKQAPDEWVSTAELIAVTPVLAIDARIQVLRARGHHIETRNRKAGTVKCHSCGHVRRHFETDYRYIGKEGA